MTYFHYGPVVVVELVVLDTVDVFVEVEVLLDVLVTVEVLLVVLDTVVVLVEVVELVDVDVELDEVDVQVKSVFPNKNSDMLLILNNYSFSTSRVRPSIQNKIILYRKDSE